MALLEVLDESEVTAAPLAFTEPVRDIEAELQVAREQAYTAGYAACASKLTAEYSHQLGKRMPRAPIAVEMLPVLEGIAVLLGIRVMLGAALIGTFVLAFQAMAEPSVMRIVIFVAFGAAAVAPLCWLATRRSG